MHLDHSDAVLEQKYDSSTERSKQATAAFILSTVTGVHSKLPQHVQEARLAPHSEDDWFRAGFIWIRFIRVEFIRSRVSFLNGPQCRPILHSFRLINFIQTISATSCGIHCKTLPVIVGKVKSAKILVNCCMIQNTKKPIVKMSQQHEPNMTN